MADVNTPDASVATNASNKTQYFDLPLFIATDKPSWLVDWNGAMSEIDKILNDIATASEGAVADVATIQTQINTLSTTVTSLNGIVETAVQDVATMQTTVDSHETRMDTIEGDLITQNNLIKALSTSVTTMQGTVASLNTAVESMQTTLAGYDSRITGAEDAATAAQTAVAGIQSTVQSLSSTVAGHTTQISGLDGRVTALEQGGGGMPTFTDINFSSATKQWSDVTGTRTTLVTTAAERYVYVSLRLENATAVTTQASQQPQFGIYAGDTSHELLTLSINNTTEGFAASATSGLVKVPANTEIFMISSWNTSNTTSSFTLQATTYFG